MSNIEKERNIAAFKAGIWYTAVNFLTKGTIFLTTPIFTRVMSPEDVGSFANIHSWYRVFIFLVTFDFCTSLSLARFDYREELDRYTSSILVYGTAITAFFYIIVNIKLKFFSNFFSIPEYALHIIFINIMMYPALQMYLKRNSFDYRYKQSAIVSFSSLILSVGLSIILVLTMRNQLLGRLIGMFLSVTALYLVLYIQFIIKGGGVSLKYLGYALRISFPMIWHTVAIHLLGTGDRLVITKMLGPEKNALYSVAYTCSIIASVLWSSMNSAWSPWSAERMNKGETLQMKSASRPYVIFFALIILGMLLVTPEILLLMGGKRYMQAIFVLPPVIVGCLCQFVYSLYVNAEFYLKKQNRIAFATMITASLNIGLNIIFVPRFGYVAAAYTTLFSYLFLLIFHFGSLVNLGKNDWYDNQFNFTVIGVFILLIPLVNFLYLHNHLRYIILLLLSIASFAMAWVYRVWIIDFLKQRLFKKR